MDTASHRFSAIHTGGPWRGIGTLPSGTVDQAARQAVAFLYAGILAEAGGAVMDSDGTPVTGTCDGGLWSAATGTCDNGVGSAVTVTIATRM